MDSIGITIRGLARAPAFTITAILSLALGIGVTTSIFSLLDYYLIRKLSVRNPEELVFLYHPGPLQGSVTTDEPDDPSFSYPLFRALQKEKTPFNGLAAAAGTSVNLSYKNHAEAGMGRFVSGNYFTVLGVRPAIGRLLVESDDLNPGEHPVVVVSHQFWSSRFGKDVSAVNQTIVINGNPMTVVGVAPKGFSSDRLGSAPDVFIPICMKKAVTPNWDGFGDRLNHWVTLLARLKPGISRSRAESDVNHVYRAQLEEEIALFGGADGTFLDRFRAKRIILKPGKHGRGGLRWQSEQPLTLAITIAGMVLLICCANVTNLVLARTVNRRHEIGVRLAMGASRGRLIRQLLAESCLIAAVGGALGVAVAQWTTHGLLAAIPTVTFPRELLDQNINIRVVVFCGTFSLVTGVLVGLVPTLHASRIDLVSSLKAEPAEATTTLTANLLRKGLVTSQMGIALLLLVCTGLLTRSLVNLGRVDPGLRIDHLLTFSISPKMNGYTDQRAITLYEQVLERLATIPGVLHVSTARVPTIAGAYFMSDVRVGGAPPQSDDSARANLNGVGPAYFRTMGIRLIAGREFDRSDDWLSPRVAVVNEAFVRHFLAGQSSLGRRFAQGRENVRADTEIVGVVADSKYGEIREVTGPVYYLPHAQMRGLGPLTFYLRTSIDPQDIASQVRREIAALDPNLPVWELKSMRAQLEERLYSERNLAFLSGILATLAILLAAVGLYGVVAYNVARRTREIGIRVVLGASPAMVGGLIARDVFSMLAVGTLLGCSAAAGLGWYAQSFLYEIKPWDLTVYFGALVVIWLVAILAAGIASRNAIRLDPTVALRYE